MKLPSDLRSGHISRAKLAGLATEAAGKHVGGVSNPRRRLAAQDLEARLLLQEREESHIPRDVDTKSLPLALSR